MKTGTKILISGRLKRKASHNDKVWIVTKLTSVPGIFLGKRTVNNGKRWFDSEYGYTYEPKEYLAVALVILDNGRENPFYCPLNLINEIQPERMT